MRGLRAGDYIREAVSNIRSLSEFWNRLTDELARRWSFTPRPSRHTHSHAGLWRDTHGQPARMRAGVGWPANGLRAGSECGARSLSGATTSSARRTSPFSQPQPIILSSPSQCSLRREGAGGPACAARGGGLWDSAGPRSERPQAEPNGARPPLCAPEPSRRSGPPGRS